MDDRNRASSASDDDIQYCGVALRKQPEILRNPKPNILNVVDLTLEKWNEDKYADTRGEGPNQAATHKLKASGRTVDNPIYISDDDVSFTRTSPLKRKRSVLDANQDDRIAKKSSGSQGTQAEGRNGNQENKLAASFAMLVTGDPVARRPPTASPVKALPPDEELLPPEVELEYEKLLLFGRRRCLGRKPRGPKKPLRQSQPPWPAFEATFKTGGTCVNKILQIGKRVIVAGPIEGGGRDGRWNINNDGSNLIAWDSLGGVTSLDAHGAEFNTGVKYYHVHDIARDHANPFTFASSGHDGSAHVWALEEGDFDEPYELPSPACPLDIKFRPVESALAIAYSDGVVQVYSKWWDVNIKPINLNVVPRNGPRNHAVGPLAWGHGTRSHVIWASSEPPVGYRGKDRGWHCRFDVPTGTRYSFDVLRSEEGDAIAVDVESNRVALFTTGDHSYVRLLDDREELRSTTAKRFMLSRPGRQPNNILEVSRPSFSQDGIYLAVPHNDNATLVYDSRLMSAERGPLYDFRHGPPQHVRQGNHHGVVDAQWIENRFGCAGYGLVTGGNDGCIRVWDVRRSVEDLSNGAVLAQMHEDVAHFSVGALHSEERPLVAGDIYGEVWVFK